MAQRVFIQDKDLLFAIVNSTVFYRKISKILQLSYKKNRIHTDFPFTILYDLQRSNQICTSICIVRRTASIKSTEIIMGTGSSLRRKYELVNVIA